MAGIVRGCPKSSKSGDSLIGVFEKEKEKEKEKGDGGGSREMHGIGERMDYWERLGEIEDVDAAFMRRAAVAHSYTVELFVNQPQRRIEVTGTAQGEILAEACMELHFLLGRNLEREDFADVTLAQLQLNGHDVAWKREGDRFTIALPRRLSRGESFAVAFQYSAVPLARKCWVHSRASGMVPGVGDGESELCYEGCWLPIFDDMFYPVSTDIFIREALGQQIIFNGNLLNITETTDGPLYHFTSVMPGMPTVIVGDFITRTISDGAMRMTAYFQPGYERSAEYALALAEQIAALYTEWFVINPANDFMLVQLRRSGFGQYAPSPLVAFPRQDLQPDDAYPSATDTLDAQAQRQMITMLAHEIGHFWFGGLVHYPPTQGWIGEGIATYLSEHVFEHLQGASVISKYAEAMARIPVSEHAALANIPHAHPHGFLLERVKAALVLQLLRQEIGDASFMPLLRTIVSRLQRSIATTDDIEQLCRELFPTQHVEEFFATHFRAVQEYTYDESLQQLRVKE